MSAISFLSDEDANMDGNIVSKSGMSGQSEVSCLMVMWKREVYVRKK
jgi:hypothetical protein